MMDVVIIGAGLSGLTAARDLHRAGCESFVVLEARNRVGGRTYNHDLGNGIVAEGGGTWIGPGQTAIAETLDKDLQSFFSTCEKVLADPQSPPALRTQATTALLTYKGQLAMLANLRESVSAHQRAVAAEAETRLQLSADAADKLAQVNDFLARNKG